MRFNLATHSKQGKCIALGEIPGKKIKFMIVQPMNVQQDMFAVLDYGSRERISSEIKEEDLVIRIPVDIDTIMWQKK